MTGQEKISRVVTQSTVNRMFNGMLMDGKMVMVGYSLYFGLVSKYLQSKYETRVKEANKIRLLIALQG